VLAHGRKAMLQYVAVSCTELQIMLSRVKSKKCLCTGWHLFNTNAPIHINITQPKNQHDQNTSQKGQINTTKKNSFVCTTSNRVMI